MADDYMKILESKLSGNAVDTTTLNRAVRALERQIAEDRNPNPRAIRMFSGVGSYGDSSGGAAGGRGLGGAAEGAEGGRGGYRHTPESIGSYGDSSGGAAGGRGLGGGAGGAEGGRGVHRHTPESDRLGMLNRLRDAGIVKRPSFSTITELLERDNYVGVLQALKTVNDGLANDEEAAKRLRVVPSDEVAEKGLPGPIARGLAREAVAAVRAAVKDGVIDENDDNAMSAIRDKLKKALRGEKVNVVEVPHNEAPNVRKELDDATEAARSAVPPR